MHLAGQRLKLLPFDESDLDLFVEISMSPEMMEHVYDPYSYEEANEAFTAKSQPWSKESDGWLSFGISEIVTGEKLGNIGLKITNHEAKIAEVGFMIKSSAQGKGFAGEALSLFKDFALSELDLNKLVATCSTSNTGSFKLLEKHGFIREGCLKQNVIINGNYVDDYIYGLCKSAL
ncbi:GNAT family protein [Colwellia sp. KU-HH00111]|uniref:GNAT family N-acetyltransferase n=1 Tax=Colwellia sp. KU-HH00111 TaxID=3127652 RepID=UPI003102B81D